MQDGKTNKLVVGALTSLMIIAVLNLDALFITDTYSLIMGFYFFTLPSCLILFSVSYYYKGGGSIQGKIALTGMLLSFLVFVIVGIYTGYQYLDWKIHQPTQEQINRINDSSFGQAQDVNIGGPHEGTSIEPQEYEAWYSTKKLCSVENLKGIGPNEHSSILEVFWSDAKETCFVVLLGIYKNAYDWVYEHETETGLAFPVYIYSLVDLNETNRLDRIVEREVYQHETFQEYLDNPNAYADTWQMNFEKILAKYK